MNKRERGVRAMPAFGLVLALGTAVLAGTVPALAASSGGMGGGMGGDMGAAASPREMARTAHNDGMRFKRRAQRMEEEAAEAGDAAERQAAQAEAREQWGKAVGAFQAAVGLNDRQHQSWNELGFALRHIGDYAGALAAYDRALAIKADFGEAVEYRAEALLGLGRLQDVQAAYLQLVELDDDLAATLLAALQKWSDAHGNDADAAVQTFRAWIAERAKLARFVSGTARDWRA